MTTYKIRPIAISEGPRDAEQYTYRMNLGTPTRSVSYIWYLEGSQPKTIIDTGIGGGGGGFPTWINTVEDGLGRLGLKPEDIEIVIVTHLHSDHIALSSRYNNAKFIVQKTELDYTRNPHPIDGFLYRREYFQDLDIEVVDGEKEIIPGVTVFLTPGHSIGGQSVEVNTEAGKAIITGFCSQRITFEQTESMKQRGLEVAAPAVHLDVRDAYNSVLAVKRRADIVVPIHDPTYIGLESIP